MSKGLANLVTWAPFLPKALRGHAGTATVRVIASKQQAAPAALLSPTMLAVVGIGFVLAALCYAVREHRLAHREHHAVLHRAWAAAPILALALAFIAVIAGWAGA